MQDRPDAAELLEALALFLFEDLLPQLPRERRFGVRVAANAAAIVAREWRVGEEALEEEVGRMAALLGEDAIPAVGLNARVVREYQARAAAAIRAGELDDRFDEALAVLRDSVRAKLAVAHPGYDELADDGRE